MSSDAIQLHFGLVGGWCQEKMGRGAPNPFEVGPEKAAAYGQELTRLIYDEGGDVGQGNPDPGLWLSVPQYDGRLIVACAYGAGLPAWDEAIGAFWPNGETPVWSGLATVEEIKKLPLPDWDENPLVRENIRVWEAMKARYGADQAKAMTREWTDYHWTHPATGITYNFAVFPAFIDLGGFLMGNTKFLTLLGSDAEAAEALLRKCFEISASYAGYMCRLYETPLTGWCSMGGDNSCVLSPAMYRQYAMTFDALVRAHCGDLPRNLHSCGPSRHLYQVWGEYPEQEQIIVMQTRAIPGEMAPLREALPHTYLELTVHQPQVDFERETPNRVREIARDLAEALEYRDMSIFVLLSYLDDNCKANIIAMREAVAEINAEKR